LTGHVTYKSEPARQINRLCYILMLVYNVDSFTMVQMKLEESARNETRRC